jgi:hypothetical protein
MKNVDLLSPLETAEYLCVALATLPSWRIAGVGPKYLKFGKGRTSPIRYRRCDLDVYIESCVRTSTADRGEVG